MRDKFLNKLALMRNMHNLGTPVNNNAKRAARKRYGRLPRPGVIYIPRRHLLRPPPLPYAIRKIYNNTRHHYKHDTELGHNHKKNNKSNTSSKGINTLQIIMSISVVLVIITLLFFVEKTR